MKNKKNSGHNEEIIHVKFGYSELLTSKRNILSLQMSLLQVLKTIKRYHVLRSEELSRKMIFDVKLKQFNKNMKSLSTTLPKLKIPEILRKDKEIKEKGDTPKMQIVKDLPKRTYDQSLESQIDEIQNRLHEMQK